MRKFEDRIFDRVVNHPITARKMLEMLIDKGVTVNVSMDKLDHEAIVRILYTIAAELELRENVQ